MNFKFLCFILVFFTLSCSKADTVVIDFGLNKLNIEIASTPEERQKGLMNRESLKSDHGMLFVFDNEMMVSFWMKNTSIPLSIAYIDKKGEILEIHDLKPFSLEPVNSKRSSVKYALEVNRGYFSKSDIKVGDTLILKPALDYLNSSK